MADLDHQLVLEFMRRSGHPLPDLGFMDEPDVSWEDVEETEDEEEDEQETESEDDDDLQPPFFDIRGWSNEQETEDPEELDPDYIDVENWPNDALDNDMTNNSSSPPNVRPEEERNTPRREGEGEACSSSGGVGMGGPSHSQRSDTDGNRDNDGPSCPICFQAWTTDGEHRICCLPCGHIYGMSCIKKWLQQKKPGKCPQCNRKCNVNGIRMLFAPRIVAVDEVSEKRIQYLEDKCSSLESKNADWQKKEVGWQKKEMNLQSTVKELHQKMCQLKERNTHLESLLGGVHATADGSHGFKKIFTRGSSHNFTPQTELRLDGARLFDMSTCNQLLLIARRLPGMGARDALTKMSMVYPNEIEDIQLPPNTKAVKDLCMSPLNGDLALFTSLGKRLAILSLGSNNTVLAFDLPVAAWSCSWDFQSAYYIYAGLQNGNLMVFDMRQTARPVESMNGLTSNPIHSVHSLSHKSSSSAMSVLTASSIGLCQWNIDGADKRMALIPESASEGVCISLACCPHNDDIVASYRPKIEIPTDMPLTQASFTQSSHMLGQVVQGSNVHFKRVGDSFRKLASVPANVSDIRLPRSAIIGSKDDKKEGVFVCGDEASGELNLLELPSLSGLQKFKVSKHPLRDIKYWVGLNQGLLTCLSDDTFQVFSSPTS